MAIRRCPYCRAIIEEDDQYCKNCGTQLLFPEDELIEEDIPGEEITHADVAAEEESKEGEEEPVDEAESEEACGTLSDEDEDKILGEEEEEKKEEKEGAEAEVEAEAETTEEPAKEETKAKSVGAKEELTFKTDDLDLMGPTVEQAKEEIDRYLESFKKDKSPPTDEKRPPQERENIPSLTGVLEKEVLDEGEGLPPWADKIREPSPPPEIQEIAEDERKRTAEQEKSSSGSGEDAEWRKPSVTDSGIGIPERVTRSLTQTPLPFEGTPTRQEKEEVMDRGLEETGEFEPSPREAEEKAPAINVTTIVKARLFDLLFVTAIWLISLWLAARTMAVNLFKLISAAASPALIFYGILLVAYFFLFLFFLGETLGDRLFSIRD